MVTTVAQLEMLIKKYGKDFNLQEAIEREKLEEAK